MTNMIKNFWKDEEGATAIEYGLIAGLIAVAIIAAVTAVGGGLQELFTKIATVLKNTGNTVATPPTTGQ